MGDAGSLGAMPASSYMPDRDPELASLSFRYPFRKYQKMMLAQFDASPGNRKFHIVAPPGSGKTIVGLELIRRFAHRAVVFAPTTTIQSQWREKTDMFTEDASKVSALSSTDPSNISPINIYTYQLISTPGDALEHGRQMAVKHWAEALVVEGQAQDEASAAERIEVLRKNNPREYGKEIRRRYLRVKRDLLRRDDIDVESFLHPNARKLIDDLVKSGVRTVVLDECHHLLDYWAIVLRYLIKRIHAPVVIGLTATLPSLEDDEEYFNYTSILGDVDFEVPTPAVVKEGDLAPYRSLAYFVYPSRRELDYLGNIQEAFEKSVSGITIDPAFDAWVKQLVVVRSDAEGGSRQFEQLVSQYPSLAVAAIRYLSSKGYQFTSSLSIPDEAEGEMDLDDWAVILERYALDCLKTSENAQDHARLSELRRALRPFGITLTETGLRQGRSAGDLVLALSEGKDEAVKRILAAESRAMGDRLRVMVVTDFERMTTLSEDLKSTLDRDAGSAIRVFRSIVHDPESGKLDPILVTGKTVLADADHGERLLALFNNHLKEQNCRASCKYGPTPFEGVLEVVGEGADWSPRTYVRMVTEAFEKGHTKCIVGTRGIFGEGWDSLSLNTLIDLTSVTTSTSVQQLRGRGIRKDPSWSRKVAHNWDVICVAPKFKRGDSDLRRFEKRHNQYWGIVSVPKRTTALKLAVNRRLLGRDRQARVDRYGALGPEMHGRVVKGVAHVDPGLAFQLATGNFQRIDFRKINGQMLDCVNTRESTYDLWGVGEPYSNFSFSATRLDAFDLKIRTVYTVKDTLKKMIRSFAASFLGALVFVAYIEGHVLRAVTASASWEYTFEVIGALIAFAFAAALVLNIRDAYRLAHRILAEQPPDAILLDIGRAILDSLRQCGLVGDDVTFDNIRVVEQTDGSYEVFLDYASPEAAAVFIRSYRDLFRPVRHQRYLILRSDARLPNLLLSPIWLALRTWYGRSWGYKPAYHPVPQIMAANKDRAEAFARCWRKYVGGGKLVFTNSDEGRRILYEAKAQRRPKLKDMAFEVWR